jgi:glyoxylase-like metal-dependent hydrolase (beta-lactamase superfamily II)
MLQRPHHPMPFRPRALRAALKATLLAAGLVAALGAAHAAPAGQPAQAGIYRYKLGDFQVTALSDGTIPLDLHKVLKDTTEPEVDTALAATFHGNPVEESINAYLVDTGSRLVLIDTGTGDFFGEGNGKLVARLKAAGVDPAQVDDILVTHLHPDHSGGLVHDGKVVFPKAIVHIGQADVDFFMAPGNQNGVNGYDKPFFVQGTASLAPYKANGHLVPFKGPTQFVPGITAIPTPGHTPGHSFYRVESKGASITFIGDMVHAEAVQFAQPAVTVSFDVDNGKAAAQRAAQFKSLAGSRELVAGAHLPFPGIGHIRREPTGYAFVPVDYADRSGQ